MNGSKYVDLISSASIREFAENRVASFTNRLAKALVLDGNWEVGLLEVVHPKVSTVSMHEGEVYLHGNVPQSFTKKFIIDYSLKEPYKVLENAAKKVEEKVNTTLKPGLHKDVNGIYSLLIGGYNVTDKWKCTAHVTFENKQLEYLGLEVETFKVNPKGKTYKNHENVVYHENIAPRLITSPQKFKVKIWTDPKEEEITIDAAADDTIAKLVKKFNAAIDKYWMEKGVDENTHPKPTFKVGNDGRLEYRPGLFEVSKMETVMLRFDDTTMKLLGFKDVDFSKIEPKDAYFRPYSGTSHLIYLYTDVVQEHNQGDIMGNSLRVLPITDQKEIHHKRFSPIIYHPVKRKIVDTITISLNDDSGRNPEFSDGVTHVTLHFKRVKSLY